MQTIPHSTYSDRLPAYPGEIASAVISNLPSTDAHTDPTQHSEHWLTMILSYFADMRSKAQSAVWEFDRQILAFTRRQPGGSKIVDDLESDVIYPFDHPKGQFQSMPRGNRLAILRREIRLLLEDVWEDYLWTVNPALMERSWHLNEEDYGRLRTNQLRKLLRNPHSEMRIIEDSMTIFWEGPKAAHERSYQLIRRGQLSCGPVNWQVQGLIERGTLVEFFGEWSSGKTFVLLELLTCIATGTHYQNRAVEQGSVIYFCGEGQRGIGRRLRALELQQNIDLNDHPFFLSTTSAALIERGDVTAIEKAVSQIDTKPAHICFDTRSRNFGPGDENSPGDMAKLIAACDYLRDVYDCTVSVVHHPGHMEKGRGRGHSSWQGALDVSYQVSKTACGIITVEVGKPPKDFDPPETFHFKLTPVDLDSLDEEGNPETSCILAATDAPAKRQRPQGSGQTKLLQTLKQLVKPTNGSSPSEGVPIPTVTGVAWKGACLEAGISENTFYTAKRALLDKGLVHEVGGCFTPA